MVFSKVHDQYNQYRQPLYWLRSLWTPDNSGAPSLLPVLLITIVCQIHDVRYSVMKHCTFCSILHLGLIDSFLWKECNCSGWSVVRWDLLRIKILTTITLQENNKPGETAARLVHKHRCNICSADCYVHLFRMPITLASGWIQFHSQQLIRMNDKCWGMNLLHWELGVAFHFSAWKVKGCIL